MHSVPVNNMQVAVHHKPSDMNDAKFLALLDCTCGVSASVSVVVVLRKTRFLIDLKPTIAKFGGKGAIHHI